MNKVINSIEEAMAGIKDGARIAVPGFLGTGVPRTLLNALIEKGTRDLTFYCGSGPMLGASGDMKTLVKNGQIKKVVDSYALYRSASKGREDPFEQAVRAGEIELEVYPMGTLAEKYRAAGAGIAAFYTPTGVGSVIEEKVVTNIAANQGKKETRVFDGEKYILEYALKPDFAFVHAYTADPEGNLQYRMTARNFNHVMAMAARVTIAEVENIVELGKMDPHSIHTPGIYVQKVLKVARLHVKAGID